MATNYTTRTAALRATKADINKLDAKKLLLNGKNILDYISESEFNSYDTRDPQLKNDELDIWNTEISLSDNGHIEVKPFEHAHDTISSTQSTTLKSAVKIIDNEVLGNNDEHVMYWQADGLTDGYTIFQFCGNLTSFNSDLSSLTNGSYMFASCSNLETFNSDLSSLTNSLLMFSNCSNLTTFTSDLSSLTDGIAMFQDCTNLTSFTSDLSSLTNGEYMFFNCYNLTTFTSDLSSLTNGYEMFSNAKFTSFNGDLSSLTDGHGVFYNCYNLTTFTSDLSSLTNSLLMFSNCSNLTTFTSDLSSLTDGRYMFEYCKLDAQSVANIIHFIPQRDAKPTSATSDGNILIGIGITNTDEAKQAFAEELACADWDELNQEFDDKNWVVEWQFNGENNGENIPETPSPDPDSPIIPTPPISPASYGMRNRNIVGIYAKLEEVTMPTDEKERKPHYAYTSQDGSKFYNIHWYHESNTTNEGFDYFESLEEAISAYGVIPKE